MKRQLLLLAILIAISDGAAGQTFVGPGPDTACGGTELLVVKSGDHVTYMQHTIFQSFRTVVEEYRPLKNDDWKITLLFYSSRWQQDEPLTNDRLTEKISFTAANPGEAIRREKELGYEGLDWKTEPKRLLDHFHGNIRDFKKRA